MRDATFSEATYAMKLVMAATAREPRPRWDRAARIFAAIGLGYAQLDEHLGPPSVMPTGDDLPPAVFDAHS